MLAGALEEAAALLKPLIAARKGKASPALAALHLRLARIAGLAGDRAAELAALGAALNADKKNGELAAEVAKRAEGRRRRRARPEGAAADRRARPAGPDQRAGGVPAPGAHRASPRRDRARRHVRPTRVARRAQGRSRLHRGARLPGRERRRASRPARPPLGPFGQGPRAQSAGRRERAAAARWTGPWPRRPPRRCAISSGAGSSSRTRTDGTSIGRPLVHACQSPRSVINQTPSTRWK